MMEFIQDFNYKPGKNLQIKIGIHYGNCIFGVLGFHKPQFSLIGDTINFTSRHCTTGEKGRIIMSQQAYEQISLENIKVQIRPVYMKGKGDRNTYVYKPKAKRSRMSTKIIKSKADLISLANNLGTDL